LFNHGAELSPLLLLLLLPATFNSQVTFSIQSDGAPGIGFRTYTSLQAAATEAANSRLFAGLHFPSANWDGQNLGKLVGSYVFDNFPASPAAKVSKLQRASRRSAQPPGGASRGGISSEAVVTEKAPAGPAKQAANGRRRLLTLMRMSTV
jgi:hypothetical protein